MHIPTHRELASALLPAMVRAARIELSYFRGDLEILRKADSSPVTVADQEAEEALLEALIEVAPHIPVIAEEQYSAGIVPETDGTLFLVDALDGTRAFVKGEVDFTINVGLIVDREPVFGMVLLPANGECYVTLAPDQAGFAVLDLSDPKLLEDTAFASIGFSPIATRTPNPRSLVVALSNAHPSRRLEEELADMPIGGRVEAGSSLKFCRVAEGRADLYPRLGSISEWDIAAGHAVLRSAGGNVTKLDGSVLHYGNSGVKFRTPPFVAWGREHLKETVRFPSA